MMDLKRRLLAGLVVSTIVFGVAFAAAASLNLSVDSLSAGQDAVDACTTGANASFTTVYSGTAGGYIVNDVTVTANTIGCDGDNVAVTLDGSSISPVEESGSVSSDTATISFSADGILASEVENIAVSITE